MYGVSINEFTLAVVTMDERIKSGGGCPIFYAKDREELEYRAMLLSKVVGGMVHDMTGNTLIVVKH